MIFQSYPFECETRARNKLKRIGCIVHGILFFTLIATTGAAQGNYSNNSTKILMLEVPGETPDDPELYRAILAQLSSTQLTLDRVKIKDPNTFVKDPGANSLAQAEARGAAMVFWIEDNETCRLYFYIPDANGGRIRSRTLNLEANSSWSRYQIIAIAAASMVEGLFVTHHLKSSATKAQSSSPEILPPAGKKSDVSRKLFELSCAYAGSFFTGDRVMHGVNFGMGIHTGKPLIISLSFTQNAPVRQKTEEYQLTIKTRALGVSVAGEVQMGAFAIRPGIDWEFDLRFFSTTFQSENIDAVSDGFKAVHVLVPFFSVIWNFNDTFGIMGRVGTGFVLNDTIYKINRLDGVTEELKPLSVRFNFQAGLTAQF